MRILLLTHAFNSLSQRLFVELREKGHEVTVEFDIHDRVAEEAVELFQPDLIIAPYLKRAIPETIWRNYRCLIVHPGIKGDRGPSALDWAILNREKRWGVTVLQANGEMDAGDIWASIEFPMRDASKSSIYRREVTEAAVEAINLAIERFANGGFKPEPLDYSRADVRGQCRGVVRQSDRLIDWQCDDSETVVQKIRSADGFPGVKNEFFGRELFLYDARVADGISGAPGEMIARSGSAICVGCVDGAVWIGHLKDSQSGHPFKLPATQVLKDEVETLLEIPSDQGYRDVWYEEKGKVGYLHFPFYNGAMGSEQCERLLTAYKHATTRDTRIIVLMGGPDFWSNGMHLNLIEAADSAADESWKNINAMDDLACAMMTTESHLVISAIQGNAGAGGVFLARAADRVWARDGVILNPHYKDMGNLYGSEYWTYLLPRYTGKEHAERISQARLPMGVGEALSLGLVDRVFNSDEQPFVKSVRDRAEELAMSREFDIQLKEKRQQRARDEAKKPLIEYRNEELARMRMNFYGFDPSYHMARYNFVYKICKSRTPLTLAAHRDRRLGHIVRRAA